MQLVQLIHKRYGRKVALVIEPHLKLLNNYSSIYDLGVAAIDNNGELTSLVLENLSDTELSYDPIYEGKSDWRILPAFDHPTDVSKLMLSGTGLTHKASAENRQKMHKAEAEDDLTDSMKIYLMGVKGGKPKKSKIGVQPEWFYKGNGSILRAHGDVLEVPPYGEDGGEEPEIAGIYINDKNGSPWRVGFATANEFSDHMMERKNYLYLAPSKIRNCALGPELVIAGDFDNITGNVQLLRGDKAIWKKNIKTGEANMSHSLENLEHHHFKYHNHCLPGQAHIHFFGADAFSFGEGISLQQNDTMVVDWNKMGRSLKNRLELSRTALRLNQVKKLK